MSEIDIFNLSDLITKQKDPSNLNPNMNQLQLNSHEETLDFQEKIDNLIKIGFFSTQQCFQQAMRSLLTSGAFFKIK